MSNSDNLKSSNSNDENKDNNNANNSTNDYNEPQRQISFNTTTSSGDSMSMTSSFTTHSHDNLTGGISRTSTPAPHKSQSQENVYPSSQQSTTREIPLHITPIEPPPSNPHYSEDKNKDVDLSMPSTNSEPPRYSVDYRYKSNPDVILDVGPDYDNNYATIEEVKASLQSDRSIRMAFVRKVYLLLTLQLFLTIVLTSIFMFWDPAKTFVNAHQWLFFLSWIMTFISLLVLYWQRKKSPLNLFILLVFTVFMSYGIGTVVSMYSSKVVLQAFLITFGVFIALEVFTFQSKYDFSSWGPFLYAALWIVIFASILGWLFPYDRGYHIAISVCSALLFSAYIIYDTYMILKRVSPEEYILATVDLYLDVLNLFVAIIAIIGGTDR